MCSKLFVSARFPGGKPHTLFLQALADRRKQLFGGLLPLERRIIFGRDRFLLQEQRRPLIQLLAACR